MNSVLLDTLRIIGDSSPYLLLGFLLSGVMQVALGRVEWVSRLLSGSGPRPILWAALLGAPLPLCSCSVVPAALTLRRQGASRGATASFLVSVPETDVVSIVLTWGLLGPLMAVFRPFAAVVSAIATGLAVDLAQRWFPDADAAVQPAPECGRKPTSRGMVRDVFHFGFVELFDDLIGSLLLGLVMGGLVTALMPSLGLSRTTGGSLWTMLAMAALGVPSYVCASATTPIAVGLILGGVSPGAALVFLLSGPATNAGTILVLWRHLGRTSTLTYVTCIVASAILMGLWLDAIAGEGSTSLPAVAPQLSESLGPVQLTGLLAFLVLTVASFVRTRALDAAAGRLAAAGIPLRPIVVKVLAVLLPFAAWASAGLFTLAPGERAFSSTWGRVHGPMLGPGLHFGWPPPVGGVDRVSVTMIRRAEYGFPIGDPSSPAAASAWLLTGSEDFVDVRCAVQYRIQDAPRAVWRSLYGVEATEALMRRALESALRTALATRSIDTVYSTDRADLERRVRDELLPEALARVDAGLEIIAVNLVEVHGPPPVHAAFRDVASAVEDQARLAGAAWEYDERVTRQAAADAIVRVFAAEAAAYVAKQRAEAEARVFALQLESFAEAPEVTARRLYLECLDAVLPQLRKVLRLGADADLWLSERTGPLRRVPDEPPADQRR